jgi:hypothetical protein
MLANIVRFVVDLKLHTQQLCGQNMAAVKQRRISLRLWLSIVCTVTISQIVWWNRQTHLLDLQYQKDVEQRHERFLTRPAATTGGNHKSPNSLAIVVAGSAQRLLFNSTVHHVIKPMTKEQHEVDYFAAITIQSGPAFRQASGYMGHLAYDPLLAQACPSFRDPKSIVNSDALRDLPGIQSALQQAMSQEIESVQSSNAHGHASLQALKVLPQPIEHDPILDDLKKQRQDLFAQFPMMDLRTQALERTKAGNKNMIRLFLLLELLWKEVELVEQKRGKRYDYILLARDDTLWLDDFDLAKILATNPKADAYILSCDAREPPMMPPEINDHGVLIKRDKANVLGKYVSSMANTDLSKCHDSVTQWLGKERGCNSEMILKYILKVNNITVQLLPQSLLPFERAVVVEHNDGRKEFCFHKFCQSKHQPLRLPIDMRKCKDLTEFD